MKCPFCSSEMTEVYEKPINALHKVIDVYVCVDCLSPEYESYYKAVCNSENGLIHSDQFVINNFYVYRSHDVGKPRTAISKNITGILRTGIDVSAISLHPPVCILPGVIDFDFSSIKELLNKLNTYIIFS